MLEHDVLVVGAGLAGLRAALAAHNSGANVAITTKVHPVRSHSNAAQGGINAALTHQGDDWQEHAYETVKGSDYLGDQDAIEVMCREAGQAIIEQEHMGVSLAGTKLVILVLETSAGSNVPGSFLSRTSPVRQCYT